MAHLPHNTVSNFAPFSQRQTLFLPAPGIQGLLVTRTADSFKTRAMKFKNAQAALTWCEQHRAGLVYYFGADPAAN
jgi:hypothetical protein